MPPTQQWGDWRDKNELKQYGITEVQEDTIGGILKTVRKVDKEYMRNLVDKITCTEWPKAYVGQSTGNLNKRTLEKPQPMQKET